MLEKPKSKLSMNCNNGISNLFVLNLSLEEEQRLWDCSIRVYQSLCLKANWFLENGETSLELHQHGTQWVKWFFTVSKMEGNLAARFFYSGWSQR